MDTSLNLAKKTRLKTASGKTKEQEQSWFLGLLARFRNLILQPPDKYQVVPVRVSVNRIPLLEL